MLRTRLIHPEILAALAAAGHGSQVLVSDGNFPHATATPPAARRVYLNLSPGRVTVTEVLEALAASRPLVLVMEDLHWADPALLEFLEHLVDWATEVDLFVVATARPELFERHPGWGGGQRNSVTVSLPPLTDEHTAQLVAAKEMNCDFPPGSPLSKKICNGRVRVWTIHEPSGFCVFNR